MESLYAADSALFQLINTGLGNGLFDAVLPWCRERWFWAPFYLFILSFVALNAQGKERRNFVLGLLLAVAVADITSSKIIKVWVGRVRPCNDPSMMERVQLRIEGCGSGYSFPSSHAANHFAVASYCMPFFRRIARRSGWLLAGWAALVGFAQIYVGVHYPLDVCFGALLGIGTGWLLARIFQRCPSFTPSSQPL